MTRPRDASEDGCNSVPSIDHKQECVYASPFFGDKPGRQVHEASIRSLKDVPRGRGSRTAPSASCGLGPASPSARRQAHHASTDAFLQRLVCVNRQSLAKATPSATIS